MLAPTLLAVSCVGAFGGVFVTVLMFRHTWATLLAPDLPANRMSSRPSLS